jgi:hypothetical protein
MYFWIFGLWSLADWYEIRRKEEKEGGLLRGNAFPLNEMIISLAVR